MLARGFAWLQNDPRNSDAQILQLCGKGCQRLQRAGNGIRPRWVQNFYSRVVCNAITGVCDPMDKLGSLVLNEPSLAIFVSGCVFSFSTENLLPTRCVGNGNARHVVGVPVEQRHISGAKHNVEDTNKLILKDDSMKRFILDGYNFGCLWRLSINKCAKNDG